MTFLFLLQSIHQCYIMCLTSNQFFSVLFIITIFISNCSPDQKYMFTVFNTLSHLIHLKKSSKSAMVFRWGHHTIAPSCLRLLSHNGIMVQCDGVMVWCWSHDGIMRWYDVDGMIVWYHWPSGTSRYQHLTIVLLFQHPQTQCCCWK